MLIGNSLGLLARLQSLACNDGDSDVFLYNKSNAIFLVCMTVMNVGLLNIYCNCICYVRM